MPSRPLIKERWDLSSYSINTERLLERFSEAGLVIAYNPATGMAEVTMLDQGGLREFKRRSAIITEMLRPFRKPPQVAEESL